MHAFVVRIIVFLEFLYIYKIYKPAFLSLQEKSTIYTIFHMQRLYSSGGYMVKQAFKLIDVFS